MNLKYYRLFDCIVLAITVLLTADVLMQTLTGSQIFRPGVMDIWACVAEAVLAVVGLVFMFGAGVDAEARAEQHRAISEIEGRRRMEELESIERTIRANVEIEHRDELAKQAKEYDACLNEVRRIHTDIEKQMQANPVPRAFKPTPGSAQDTAKAPNQLGGA